MPLAKFISEINTNLTGVFKLSRVYGLAELATRGTEIIPVTIASTGEMTYLGPDDQQSVIIYHRALAIGTKPSTIKGTGDSPADSVNAYAMAMIVYVNSNKIKLPPDEVFLYIQANLPYQWALSPYKQVLLNINSVILNSQQVYAQELKGVSTPLPPHHSLLQINYTIESAFDKRCFDKCPEDC